MSSTEKQGIPWGDIGEPLAELLRYEREIGYYEHAGSRFAVNDCP